LIYSEIQKQKIIHYKSIAEIIKITLKITAEN
jgi:hypothetical protein